MIAVLAAAWGVLALLFGIAIGRAVARADRRQMYQLGRLDAETIAAAESARAQRPRIP